MVTLAEARAKALAYRKVARDGGDPLAERRQARVAARTFAEAAHASAWRNPKHAAQWANTLATYAFPHIGSRPVDALAKPDILRVLSPIWLTKPETTSGCASAQGDVARLAFEFLILAVAAHRRGYRRDVGESTKRRR